MGLFSSKKEYLAYAASSSVMEETQSTFRSLILQNNIANSGASPADALKTTLGIDMYARARAMLKYASKEDGYVRGFPTSNMDVITSNPAEIEAALTRAVGTWDTIVTQITSRSIPDFFAEQWLKANYVGGWDVNDLTVTIPVTNPNTGVNYEADNSPIVLEQSYEKRIYVDEETWARETIYTGIFDISFPYIDNTGAAQIWNMPGSVDLSGIIRSGNVYIQVRYAVGTQTEYWSYLIGSGLDPILETSIEISDRYGEYLPVIVMMQDKVWFDETADGSPNEDTPLAKTTNKMCRKLGTTGTEIREEFQEQEEEDNKSGDSKKSGADKWDFFIHFATPIRTDVRGSMEYLFHYFQQLEEWQSNTYLDYNKYLSSTIASQPLNELRVEEAGENGYNVAYRWSYCYHVEQPGTYDIYDKREAIIRPMRENEFQTKLVRREGTLDAEYRELLDEIFPALPGIATFDKKAKEENHDYIVITRQNRVPEGDPPTYTQVIMLGLGMEYTINTNDVSTGKEGYRFRFASPTIWDDEEIDLENEGVAFRFPVHAASLLKVSRMHREEILQDSLTATVTLVQVIKTKWYQTGFFKWLIIIIAVILIVLSIVYAGGAGTDQLGGLIGAMVTATGATGLAAVALYTVFAFAVGFIIALAGSLIGGTAGIIFQIIGAIAMFYSAGGFQQISTSWGNLVAQPGFGMALTFIQAVGPVFQMGMSTYAVVESYRLKQEMEEFLKSAKEKMEELRDMYDGMAPLPEGLNEWDLIAAHNQKGNNETPQEFIARSTDPNPGMKAVELINYFTEIAIIPPQKSGETSIIDGMFVDLAQQRGAV